MKARTLCEPFPDERGFVGAVVVGHDEDVQAGRYLGLNPVQKLTELGGTVPPM